MQLACEALKVYPFKLMIIIQGEFSAGLRIRVDLTRIRLQTDRIHSPEKQPNLM